MGLLKRTRLGSSKGQSAAEFAFVAPVFFFLLFGILDYGRAFFIQLNLQQAIQQAARFASTGSHLPNPSNPKLNLTRVQSIIATVQQEAVLVPGVNPQNLQISSVGGGPGSAGGPQDTATISLTTSLPLMTPMIGKLFPGGNYTFTSSATFKNEPFDPSQTN